MKFWLSPGVRIIINSSKAIIANEYLKFESDIPNFPWEDFFAAFIPPGIELSQVYLKLEHVSSDLLRRVVREFVNEKIIVSASAISKVYEFHVSSYFGHFCEEVFPIPTRSLNILKIDLEEYTSLRLNNYIGLLKMRHSERYFKKKEISWKVFVSLLMCGYASTSGSYSGVVASAGSIRPIRFAAYFINIEGIEPGLRLIDMSLVNSKLIGSGLGKILPKCNEVESLFLTKTLEINNSSIAIFILADLDETCRVYGIRGYRYILLEAGAVFQNISLAATAQKLPHVPIGAFNDNLLIDAISGSKSLVALYSIVLGGAA